jgi:hypothetical protein
MRRVHYFVHEALMRWANAYRPPDTVQGKGRLANGLGSENKNGVCVNTSPSQASPQYPISVTRNGVAA